MNTSTDSRCDQIIALIEACLAGTETTLGPGVAASASSASRADRAGPDQPPWPGCQPTGRTAPTHSALTEMLAAAHRDQLEGEAARNRLVRHARRHLAARTISGRSLRP
jgi:hypothetical protein